ncbi:integral membrane protein [Branchiibius hedensis]|uniref:Integral membrane protein n=1 Tax=Branchiibius hedensis TaxID=672460 RepID=A0A2Y8ZUP3_9MICO|nr:DUF3817 domain-containing protein [Branchiibius hedensis]PWJ26176.1 integral membrane protein [Branchiibius hedensis]SSA34988.1 integral membrane protein [Branchiibius hedensis]
MSELDRSQLIDVPKARTALTFFRVMAVIVGIGLLILVAEVILHRGFQNNSLDWWPQPHGILFIIYVAATANLGFKMRWDIPKMVGVILAGVVPFLSFYVEHRVSGTVKRELDGIEARKLAQ